MFAYPDSLCVSPLCRVIDGELSPRQAEPRRRLCWVCIDRLYANIQSLPGLYDDLLVALTRSEPSGEKITGSRDGTGLRLNDKAGNARHTLRALLVSWCRMIAEEREISLPWRWSYQQLPPGVYGPPNRFTEITDTVPAMARYVATHHDWIAAHDAAADAVAEFHELARGEAWQIAYPVGTRVREVGRCLWVGDDGRQCVGTIRAILREPGNKRGSELQCERQAVHRWGTEKWLLLAEQVHKRQVVPA